MQLIWMLQIQFGSRKNYQTPKNILKVRERR